MKKTNLETILKGLDVIREAIMEELSYEAVGQATDNKVVDLEAKKEAKKSKEVEEKTSTKETKKEAKKAKEVETTKEENSDIDYDKLSYNDLKKMAKDLGISAKGTKSDLLARVQEANGVVVADDSDEEDEEETVKDAPKNVDVEEGGDEVEDTLHDDVEAELEEYTDEELKEILESIGKSTKGKRQTLIARIVQAIEDGELDFGDSDEDGEDEENEDVESEEVEDQEDDVEETDDEEDEEEDDTEEDDDEEEDEEGVDVEDILNPLDRDSLKAICRKLELKVLKKDTEDSLRDKILAYEDEDSLVDVLIDLGYVTDGDEEDEDMEDDDEASLEPVYIGSKARIKAMKKIYKDTLEDIEEGTIKAKTVTKFLKDFHNDTWEGTKDENNKEYARIQAELVDDDGDQVELGEAYYVGDDIYCCATKVKEVDGDLYCEHCGTTYEA